MWCAFIHLLDICAYTIAKKSHLHFDLILACTDEKCNEPSFEQLIPDCLRHVIEREFVLTVSFTKNNPMYRLIAT